MLANFMHVEVVALLNGLTTSFVTFVNERYLNYVTL